MAMKFVCDDGFEAKGEDEDELIQIEAMHMLKMHPDTQISRDYLKSKLESA